MVLLARLAIDRKPAGAGAGRAVAAEALRKAIAAAEAAAARLVVVDAIDDASARFYTRDDPVVARVIESSGLASSPPDCARRRCRPHAASAR
jgi:hypothetical protein